MVANSGKSPVRSETQKILAVTVDANGRCSDVNVGTEPDRRRFPMSLPAPITAALTLSLVVPGDEPLPVDATLGYDAGDPFAVHLDIAAGDGIVRWSFARDLLTDGVEAPAGAGDVHIIPIGSPT